MVNEIVAAAEPVGEVTVYQDLQRFELMLLDQLAEVGLPVADVLVELDEREVALRTLGTALNRLPFDERGRSYYVSKMFAAAAAGLFDAALNYLWNETVGELRRRIAAYDLGYFYDIAVSSPDRRKHFSSEDDLSKIDDIDLLRGSLQIGLLSQTGHAQLDHIRYMRNYASAAHPNQVELSGLQLATWLETCIRQVITLPYDTITAETKKLLANVKSQRLDASAVVGTSAFFVDLPKDRAGAIAAGLFGLYVDPTRTAIVADNVLALWPHLWPEVEEQARHGFGLRYGRFVASADTDQATAARELLDLVDGAAYLPARERAVEIDAAVDSLLAAHRGYNNFYAEVTPARELSRLVGDKGDVPANVDVKYILALTEVYLGNAYGVSRAAESTYEDLLNRLDTRQAARALRTFTNPSISAQLWGEVGQKQWKKLLDILEPKLTASSDRALIAAVRQFTGGMDKLGTDSAIKKLVKAARQHGSAKTV